MSLSSFFPLLALVCAAVAATIAPSVEKDFADVITNRLNQDVTILHFIGVEKKEKRDVVSAVISLGPVGKPQEKVYDCKFEISKSTNDSHQKTLEKFNCEAFDVPYNAAPPAVASQYAGGWSPVKIDANDVQGVVGHVSKSLTQRNPPLQIININSAEVQIVAGINYRLTVQAGPKGADSHVTHICRVVILLQPWLNHTEVTNVECKPMGAVPYVGGWMPVANDDASMLIAANFAIKQLNRQCNCLFRKSFSDIVSASRQVVNGWKYSIVWKIGQSTCMNNEVNSDKDITECPLKAENEVSMCKVLVWEHSLGIKPYYSLVDHNC